MGVIVQFDYASWVARYPEFAAVPSTVAQLYFDEATLHHRNDGGGPVEEVATQSALLNMMTAHIAWLSRVDASGNPVNPLVGRISSAAEGSVNVSTDTIGGNIEVSKQWLLQSQYGLSYYHATAAYRQMRYKRGPRRYFGPIYGGRGGGLW